MTDTNNSDDANKSLEGGIFYPTGKMLVAVPKLNDAQKLHRKFLDSGMDSGQCELVESDTFEAQAAKNLENPGVLASLGSAVHIRQTQLDLAREGCNFLLIDTPDSTARDRNIATLSGAPVRYAVLYRKLVIEDLIHHISSATKKEEAGAPGVAVS